MEQLIAYAHEPPSALPSPASFARPATRDMQIYDDHDVEELLLGYVAPRTEMVDALGADEEEMDAQIMERAARRMYGEYVQVREHVWPMPTAREHSTGPQHLAVTSMWLNTLRLQRYAEYARTEMDSDHLAQSEFAFITHLGVAAGRAGLVLSDVPLGSFSMAQLTVAIEETCRVLCETGAGTADPDAVLVYWRALWARYVSLMEPGGVEEEEEEEDAMDLDAPEEPPLPPSSTQSILLALLETAGRQEAHVARPLTAVARPALGVAKATPPSLFDRPQYLEPLAADSGDVREGKLPLPLPLTQGASRVQLHYLFVMELRYHAFESLLQTWAAYRRAAVLPRHAPLRRVFDTLLHLLHIPDRPASGAVAALVMELHLESEESLVNVGAQNHLWTELFKAYMYPGDAEYYVLRQMEKGSFFQRSLADAPFVGAVVADLRPSDYESITKLQTRPDPIVPGYTPPDIYERIAVEWLGNESVVQAQRKAPTIERISFLLLSYYLDRLMASSGCPENLMLQRHVHMEELAHDLPGGKKILPPNADARDPGMVRHSLLNLYLFLPPPPSPQVCVD